MAKITAEYVQRGEVIDYVNPGPEAIRAGDVISVGEGWIAGVAVSDINPGETGALAVEGVFRVSKEDGAIEAGALVCIGEGKVQKHVEGDKPLGVAIAKAEATDKTVLILLNA